MNEIFLSYKSMQVADKMIIKKLRKIYYKFCETIRECLRSVAMTYISFLLIYFSIGSRCPGTKGQHEVASQGCSCRGNAAEDQVSLLLSRQISPWIASKYNLLIPEINDRHVPVISPCRF